MVMLRMVVGPAVCVALWIASPRCLTAAAPPIGNSTSARLAAIELHLRQLGARIGKDSTLPNNPITSVTLFADTIADSDISSLNQLPRLKTFILAPGIATTRRFDTRSILPQLQGLHSLYELNLSGASTSNDDCRAIAGLRNLRLLGLRGSFSDAGISSLLQCKELSELGFIDSTLSADALRSLQRFPQLERLHLINCSIHTSALVSLSRSTIRVLDLSRSPITDAHLRCVSRLDMLETLDLSNTRITGATLPLLRHSRRLKTLILDDSMFTDKACSHLVNVRQVKYLRLDNTSITDTSIPYLEQLHSLRLLSLNNTKISVTAYRRLSKSLPRTVVVYSQPKDSSK